MRRLAFQLAGEPPGRITPLGEIVNTFEFEFMARRKLPAVAFAEISGGDRTEMERYTFRSQLMVDSSKLDLTTELFKTSMFAPILIGPASDQRRFHVDGELALVRGAAAAKAVTVISSGSSFPMQKIAADAKGPLWYQVYSDALASETWRGIGFKALVITIRDPRKLDWKGIDQLRSSVKVPVVLKGLLRPVDAEEAVRRGIQGVIVPAFPMLAPIVDAVGGKMPVLADGGFRRGTDILKALILGARAVMVTRPALWGLAAYGADGVQTAMEMLQTELARNMIMIGAAGVGGLRRNMVRRHGL